MYNCKYKSNEECIVVHIKLMNNVFYYYGPITNSHALSSGLSFILIRQFLMVSYIEVAFIGSTPGNW